MTGSDWIGLKTHVWPVCFSIFSSQTIYRGVAVVRNHLAIMPGAMLEDQSLWWKNSAACWLFVSMHTALHCQLFLSKAICFLSYNVLAPNYGTEIDHGDEPSGFRHCYYSAWGCHSVVRRIDAVVFQHGCQEVSHFTSWHKCFVSFYLFTTMRVILHFEW